MTWSYLVEAGGIAVLFLLFYAMRRTPSIVELLL